MSNNYIDAKLKHTMPTKKILLTLLLVVAIGFLLKIGIENLHSIKDKIVSLNTADILIATVFCTLMLISKAILHTIIVQDFDGNKNYWKYILNAYSQSQLVRYVPGKVWGIIFQGEQLEKYLSRKIVWIVNVWQVFITNLNGIGIIIFFVLFYFFGNKPYIYFALATIPITFYLFKINALNLITTYIDRLKYIDLTNLPQINFQSFSRSLSKTILLQLDWFFYFLFWFWLLPESSQFTDCFVIASIYAGAALFGLIVLVVPSGWFVREASFIWFGLNLGYTEDLLFLFGVLARLISIVSDILCVITLGLITKLFGDRL